MVGGDPGSGQRHAGQAPDPGQQPGFGRIGEGSARGIDARQCVAYVYGGGNMFPSQITDRHVGQRNADWVLDALARSGIRVVHEDLGGRAYRRLSWTVGPDAPQVVAVQM